jgi:hypothetical protein
VKDASGGAAIFYEVVGNFFDIMAAKARHQNGIAKKNWNVSFSLGFEPNSSPVTSVQDDNDR